jgi:hypothetical protein
MTAIFEYVNGLSAGTLDVVLIFTLIGVLLAGKLAVEFIKRFPVRP